MRIHPSHRRNSSNRSCGSLLPYQDTRAMDQRAHPQIHEQATHLPLQLHPLIEKRSPLELRKWSPPLPEWTRIHMLDHLALSYYFCIHTQNVRISDNCNIELPIFHTVSCLCLHFEVNFARDLALGLDNMHL